MKNLKQGILVGTALSSAVLCVQSRVAHAGQKLSETQMEGVSGATKLSGQACLQAGTGSCVWSENVRNGKCVSDMPVTWNHCVADPNAPKGVKIECADDVISCGHIAWIPVNEYNQHLAPTVGLIYGGTCRDAPGQTSVYIWNDYEKGCDLG